MFRSRMLVGFIVLTMVALLGAGCGGAKKDDATSNIPDWYLSPPSDPQFYYGTGTGDSRKLQIAVRKATQDATLNVAEQIETRFRGLTETFTEEVGMGEDSQLLEQFTQATQSVVSNVMSGLKPTKREVVEKDGMYTAYVLIEYDQAAAAAALANQVKKQEQLYTRMRSSETLKKLEQEAQKFEDYKSKEQMP